VGQPDYCINYLIVSVILENIVNKGLVDFQYIYRLFKLPEYILEEIADIRPSLHGLKHHDILISAKAEYPAAFSGHFTEPLAYFHQELVTFDVPKLSLMVLKSSISV